MNLTQLKNKRIAIIGLGLTGQSCARYLLHHDLKPVGFDTRAAFALGDDLTHSGFEYYFGEIDADELSGFEVILLSPGVSLQTPAIAAAKLQGAEVTGDIELFCANCSKPIIGITGSNGKSTVVSMLAKVFAAAGTKAAMGGNIGIPALDLLEDDFDVAVLELSSFQLETVRELKLRVAAVLNISEDHMDRYPDFQAYCAAKHRIYDGAQFTVANQQDLNSFPPGVGPGAQINSEKSSQGFAISQSPLAITFDGEIYLEACQMQVNGLHNLLNAQAVAIIASEMGVAKSDILSGLIAYNGLSHRCQKVSDYKDITWVNDSKATNVGATIAAIKGLKPGVTGKLWLVAGGDAKNADLLPLQKYLQRDVDKLITIGKDAQLLAELKPESVTANSMEDAVQIAAIGAKAGDMVLLSPACASLDMYKNYEQRGDVFTKAVEALA